MQLGWDLDRLRMSQQRVALHQGRLGIVALQVKPAQELFFLVKVCAVWHLWAVVKDQHPIQERFLDLIVSANYSQSGEDFLRLKIKSIDEFQYYHLIKNLLYTTCSLNRSYNFT